MEYSPAPPPRGRRAGRTPSPHPVMMESAFPAARMVAGIVEEHFRDHLSAARREGETQLASAPDREAVEAIVDAAFWASLRREEGRSPRISLAYLSPEQTEQPLLFARRLPLDPGALTRLAPAVERPGIHLGVWRDDGELRVWGTTRTIPSYCFVLEVVQPGLLVVKHRRGGEFGKYANVAVLEGDQVKVVRSELPHLPDCPGLVTTLLDFGTPVPGSHSIHVLVQLAASMRAHGHGGSLLVVPDGSERWRESIVRPIAYPVEPAYAGLAALMRREPAKRSDPAWQEEVRRAVDAVAGLTAVDGATLITESYELLAFGAKIARAEASGAVDRVVVTEPVEGSAATVQHPAQIGGTRHLSAAQFVHDQRDAVALVASQDGRFTVFAWSPCEGMVHAHRVETLLL